MQKTFRLVLFLFILLHTGLAQEAAWYQDKPIADIQFTGLGNVPLDELEGLVAPFIGKKFTQSLFMDLQNKLYGLNYFERLKASALEAGGSREKVIISFEVFEYPVIDKIVISGNSKVKKNDILDVILTVEDEILNKGQVRIDAQEIKRLYLEKGFPDITVEWNEEQAETEDRVTLTFSISEGIQTKVSKIQFSGITFASATTLKTKLETKEQSLFSTGIFQENKIETDVVNLTKYYTDRGFVDMKVLDVQREFTLNEEKQTNYLNLTYYIEEGKRYTFGGFSFTGNTLFTYEELLSDQLLKMGSFINLTKLQTDLQKINQVYANEGYVYNVITPEEVRNEEENSIAFILHISERPRAHIENITVAGNQKTKANVITREIPLVPGDIFYMDKVIEAYRNLYALEYFSSIDIQNPPGSADGLLDLVITVEENQNINLNFGFSIDARAEIFPLVGFFEWSDPNLLGRGQSIAAKLNLSESAQSVSFSFTENWLAGIRWMGGVEFAYTHENKTNILQDFLPPYNVGVPDPYFGYYVYKDTGLPFEGGTPTAEEITGNNLITDYDYALQNNIAIPVAYLMDYEAHNFTLGISTGYAHSFPSGLLKLNGLLKSLLGYINYDPLIERAFEQEIRENLKTWQFINSFTFSTSFNNLDNPQFPRSGYSISQSTTYTGGILGGARDFIKNYIRGSLFLPLFDFNVGDLFNLSGILNFNTTLSFLFPQFAMLRDGTWGWTEENRTSSDLLSTDSMITGIGWPRDRGELLLDASLQYNMPIPYLEDILWLKAFFSTTGVWDDYTNLTSMSIDDFKFSIGLGLRLVIPIFPISVYLVKRFDISDGAVRWQEGSQKIGDAFSVDVVFDVMQFF